jgi:hypothetical protein
MAISIVIEIFVIAVIALVWVDPGDLGTADSKAWRIWIVILIIFAVVNAIAIVVDLAVS